MAALYCQRRREEKRTEREEDGKRREERRVTFRYITVFVLRENGV
jgi:hypothetical protein